MQHLLLVDDSSDIKTIVEAIFAAKYHVSSVATLAQARKTMEKQRFDLILLDISLPDGSGLGLLAELAADAGGSQPTPVFLLTGTHHDAEKMQAFQLGAEDYITKPFSHKELRARVDARMRRLLNATFEGLKKGNLSLNTATQRATLVDDKGVEQPIDFSPIEFKLLFYFMRHEDHVLSRQQIMEAVWGNHIRVLDRTVDVHVSRLRKKLEASDYNVNTVVGAGYAFRRGSTGDLSKAA